MRFFIISIVRFSLEFWVTRRKPLALHRPDPGRPGDLICSLLDGLSFIFCSFVLEQNSDYPLLV